MWKETIICVVIVIAIIVANVITQNYTVESVKYLSEELGELREDILNIENNENMETQIKEKIDKTVNDWEKRHDKLAYYIEHDELEKVETNLTGMKSFIESKEYADSLSELDKNIFILKHIEDKYAFNLQNIF
ncbi:MAG: DUF4363 family protein [Clostridia bacterium]|nr:DUF4363 family protein [Clostridia bacterium]